MALVDAISGQPPEEPVFSPTGYIFERRLIEKHLKTTGKCPISGSDLSADDLKPINISKSAKPRPLSAQSLPGLLTLFQNEWDSIMAETFQLRQHLDTVRNQLSHSLYQHDAACRVIARLVRERDAARANVAQLQQQLAAVRASGMGVVDVNGETGITDEIVGQMQELAERLKPTRKHRQFPNIAPAEAVKQYVCTSTHPIHSSTTPGITCCDVDRRHGTRVASGGMDSQVILFDVQAAKSIAKLSGHTKRVNAVEFHSSDDVVISVSDDKTARVWQSADGSASGWKCAQVVRKHAAEVVGLSIHPLGSYVATSAKDGSWAFSDIGTGRTLRTFRDLGSPYHSIKIHPDGIILGGGAADGTIAIWDLQEQVVKASLEGHSGPVSSLSFSENGYYLASSSLDGTVKLWDLRKQLVFQTLKMDGPVHKVRFDHSGQYLVAAGPVVQVWNFETKNSVGVTMVGREHTDRVTDACFGPDCGYVISTSMDRALKVWSQA